jgi:hypothetical protein
MSFLTTWPRERYLPTAFDDFKATSALHLGTARALMWMSQLAYEPDFLMRASSTAKVEDILNSWNLKLARLISVPVSSAVPLVSRDAIVAIGHDAIIVAFAGTDPARLQDWATNFNQKPAATGISTGYGSASSAVVPDFQNFLAQQINPPLNSLKIFITGHSLGGALAVGLADELSRQNVCNVEAVYTYGMPRTGNSAFAASYDQPLGQRTYRFVHGDDVVPMVPPVSFHGQTNQHVGFLLHCARDATFVSGQQSSGTTSNDPDRTIADILASFVEVASLASRLQIAADVLNRGGSALDVAIELSPPRVRQHLQDRYIAALTA